MESRLHRHILRLAAISTLVAAVLAPVLWFGAKRLERLAHQLEASEKKAAALQERLRHYGAELDAALERARAARQEAELEAQRAQAAEEARRQAERLREEAAEEALRARAETEEAQRELELIRLRRARELDRMQEALDRIAPTRRTPSGMVMTLADNAFRFDFDQATLRPENRETLSRIAGVLLASEGYRLFIDGHTDDIGTEEYNLDLSRRRAQAVRDYLVKAGIPAELITIQGFGKSQPLVKAATREARAQNRRVEIGIVDTIIQYDQAVRN